MDERETMNFFFVQLTSAESDTDVQNVFAIDEAMELLAATGFRKAVPRLKLEDCSTLVSALVNYHFMGKVKAEMDQLRDGLEALGFLSTLRHNPDIFEPFFLNNKSELTTGMLLHN